MSDKKFNPKNKNKLNDNKRLKLIPPDIIVKYLDLKESGNIVDYGAGTGFFTFILAEYFTIPYFCSGY
jgi:predicted methyltransferase